MSAVTDPDKDQRARLTRARNRALVAVLVGLVGLFYAITIVKIGG